MPSAGAAPIRPRDCGRPPRCRSRRSRTARRWRSWSSTGRRAFNEVTVIDENEAGWSRIARPATGDLLGGRLGEAEAARQAAGARHHVCRLQRGWFQARRVGRRDRRPRRQVFACAKEIPLVAEVGPQRRTVGSIGGGVHLRTTATADAEFVAVQFPDGAAAAVTPRQGHAPAGPPRRRPGLPRIRRRLNRHARGLHLFCVFVYA